MTASTKTPVTVLAFLKKVAAGVPSRTHNQTIAEAVRFGFVRYSEGERELVAGVWKTLDSGWRLTDLGRAAIQ